jgi:hypothetical protein
MPEVTKAEKKQALATVSSFKRAIGIPNHATKRDTFIDETIHIYISGKESAELMGELLYRYGNGPREKFYNAHPEKFTIRDTVQVKELPEGGYDVSMHIPWPRSFTEAMEKMMKKYIGPDSTFTR